MINHLHLFNNFSDNIKLNYMVLFSKEKLVHIVSEPEQWPNGLILRMILKSIGFLYLNQENELISLFLMNENH